MRFDGAMNAFRWLLLLIFPVLSSCDSSDKAKEVTELEASLEDLYAETERQGEEYKKMIDDLEVDNTELAKATKKAQRDLTTVEEELAKVREDFDDYKKGAMSAIEKYVAKIQKNGIGEKLPSHRVGGKLLEDLEIVGINLEEIRVKHRNGYIGLDKNTAPIQWVEKYFFEKSEYVPEETKGTQAVVKADDDQPAPAATSGSGASFDPKKAIVLIEGDDGAGTGFFVRTEGAVYLYTAAHVLSGNKKLTVKTTDGREFRKFGTLEVAQDVDMVRLKVLGTAPLALDLTSSGGVRQDMEIQALGNSGGGSVINDSEGIIQAVGSESFEITAQVIQGNSGGPIIRKGTTVALGLVTHGIQGRDDVWASNTRFTKIRRFGARLDREIKWTKISLSQFLKEPDLLNEFDRTTRLLFALSVLRPTANGLRLTTVVNGQVSAMQIFNENQDMAAVKELIKMNTELAAKKIKPDPRGVSRKFAAYYRGIVEGSRRQVDGLRGLSPFHREVAKGSLAARKKAHEEVEKLMKIIEE